MHIHVRRAATLCSCAACSVCLSVSTRALFCVGPLWYDAGCSRLYCEEIDVGEEMPRKIASGLVPHYSLEEMKGRRVIVMCNLKVAAGAHTPVVVAAVSGSKHHRLTWRGEGFDRRHRLFRDCWVAMFSNLFGGSKPVRGAYFRFPTRAVFLQSLCRCLAVVVYLLSLSLCLVFLRARFVCACVCLSILLFLVMAPLLLFVFRSRGT